jgi:uncharacterized protein YndB with AHSA1/START domain
MLVIGKFWRVHEVFLNILVGYWIFCYTGNNTAKPRALNISVFMQREYSILINAPIEKAFACVNDDDKINRWMGGDLHTKYENLKDPENPVGTKYRQTIKGIIEIEGEVIAYKKPEVLGVGQRHGKLKNTVFYRFTSIDENTTKLVLELEVIDGGMGNKILVRALSPLYDRLLKKQLQGIKSLAEEQ